MMQAMIFAAGLGTRLKPLTDAMPKALIPVGGQPLLAHTINRLRDTGAERIVINVHHFATQIVDYLASIEHEGVDIRISDETAMLLDTGGGIRKAEPLFDSTEPILIHNVDILSNVNLSQFYSFSHSNDATLLVSERKTKRYLLFDDGMRLVGWTNIETGEVRSPHPNLDPSRCRMLAFSGIHTFSPSLFPLMKELPDRFGIMDFYLQNCHRANIRGCIGNGLQLMDVGKLDTLREAETFLSTCNPLCSVLNHNH